MQEKHLFEYSVIRVVPRVEREEFLNVGVIMYCTSKRFLHTMYELNENRLRALFNDIDLEELANRLQAFKQICEGGADGGAIGKLPIASRFRWLTASRSTIVQTSPVHAGFCVDPIQEISKLFIQLIK
jgi:hypothetical protein